MSSESDVFEDARDAPWIGLFINAANDGYEATGEWSIPEKTRIELMASLCLSRGEAAAYSYLGARRAEDIHEAFDDDDDLFAHITGGIHE